MVVPVEDRKYGLAYYHANRELMNVQSYLNKLNRGGRTPHYAHMVAYELFKSPEGKWCMSDACRQKMKELARKRQAPEVAPAPPPAPTVQERYITVNLLDMVRDMLAPN